jgi:hypothetical protein
MRLPHKSTQLNFVLVMPPITLSRAVQKRNEKMPDL